MLYEVITDGGAADLGPLEGLGAVDEVSDAVDQPEVAVEQDPAVEAAEDLPPSVVHRRGGDQEHAAAVDGGCGSPPGRLQLDGGSLCQSYNFV